MSAQAALPQGPMPLTLVHNSEASPMRTRRLSLLPGILLLMTACATPRLAPVSWSWRTRARPWRHSKGTIGHARATSRTNSAPGPRRGGARRRHCSGAMVWPMCNVCMPRAMPYHRHPRRRPRRYLRQPPRGPEPARCRDVTVPQPWCRRESSPRMWSRVGCLLIVYTDLDTSFCKILG
jgi:hypothetical protein